jgi:DNA polymerase III delta subunit
MGYLLHGGDQVKSRNFLNELKEKARKKTKEIINLDGESVELSEVKQALESSSLFGKDKLIVIDNLYSSHKSNRKKEVISYLKKESPQNLIIWENKKIDGRKLKGFSSDFKIKKFKLNAVIFKFLESLKPNNEKESIFLFQKCLKDEEPEKVFYMLVRQFSILIKAKDLGKKGLSGPGWMKHKFLGQAENFSLKQLKSNYKKLLEIDIGVKTGKSIMPLKWRLEQFISNM